MIKTYQPDDIIYEKLIDQRNKLNLGTDTQIGNKVKISSRNRIIHRMAVIIFILLSVLLVVGPKFKLFPLMI